MMRRFVVSGSLLLALTAGVRGQDGHDIRANQVVISDEEHWQQWRFPEGTVDVLPAGEVGPHFWRKGTSAATELDIVQNLRRNPPEYLSKKAPEEFALLDAILAGSNHSATANLFDDDLSTYWEPSFPDDETIDPASQAWFTVDLGKIVMAEKIVLKFVDADLGDPFLLFDVLTSDGQTPTAAKGAESLEFARVHTTLEPNKSQRLFEIDMSQFSRVETVVREARSGSQSSLVVLTQDPEVRKRLVRRVQVVVHGSAFRRGRQVSEEIYDSVRVNAPRDTGMVEYVKKLEPSGELAVSKEVWEELPSHWQGPVRYWLRERPRLAELEVWSKGDDIFEGFARRCQEPPCMTSTLPFVLKTETTIIDGDLSSSQNLNLNWYGHVIPDWHHMRVDLGSVFWVDGYRHMIQFRGSEHSRTFAEWRLGFSDGSLEVDGSLKWDRKLFDETPMTRSQIIVLDEADFEPIKARYVRLEWLTHPEEEANFVNLAEVQVFGEGYQPEVTLTSDLIWLRGSRNLFAIEWDADTPPGTEVALQTRTGARLDTAFHYFRIVGEDTLEIVKETEAEAKKTYDKLKLGKGPIVPELVAAGDWEPWSEPYTDPEGSAITSPSPREYLLIRATLRSDDPHTRAALKSIRLSFDSPVARRLVGELTPGLVEVLGEARPYVLEVAVDTLTAGFDELLVRPPAGMQLTYGTIYAGKESELAETADMSGLALSAVETLAEGDSLHLSFPAIERSDDVERIRLEFTGTLFSAGGRLHASLRRSESGQGGAWQRVDEKVARTSLTVVATTQSNGLFRDLTIDPPVLTPNGDGVNEELTLAFTVLLAAPNTAVTAEIFDLSGRLVARRVEVREVSTGPFEIAWDGRNQDGDLVPPGVYAVRLGVDGDTGDTALSSRELLRTIAVAY